MEVKMTFQKKGYPPIGDCVTIELSGSPTLVEILRKLIIDFMVKQEGFEKHY